MPTSTIRMPDVAFSVTGATPFLSRASCLDLLLSRCPCPKTLHSDVRRIVRRRRSFVYPVLPGEVIIGDATTVNIITSSHSPSGNTQRSSPSNSQSSSSHHVQQQQQQREQRDVADVPPSSDTAQSSRRHFLQSSTLLLTTALFSSSTFSLFFPDLLSPRSLPLFLSSLSSSTKLRPSSTLAATTASASNTSTTTATTATTPTTTTTSSSSTNDNFIRLPCDTGPTCRSVEIRDFRVGTGRVVEPGSTLVLKWTGRLADRYGWPFQRETEDDLTIVLDDDRLIRGFRQGIAGMREGGKRRLLIPGELGYQDEAAGPLPNDFGDRRRLFATVLNKRRFKNAGDLVIDVQLKKVRPPGAGGKVNSQ